MTATGPAPGSEPSVDLGHGPLTGTTVVDVSVAIQGPHASAYLADLGAEVVKVERPGGELNRYVRSPGLSLPPEVKGPQYVAMNRGKRGIVVDAHEELGREVLHRLVAGADVFVTNYRREALERMGLGWPQLSALNRRLVYARVGRGHGRTGVRARRHRPCTGHGRRSGRGHHRNGPRRRRLIQHSASADSC